MKLTVTFDIDGKHKHSFTKELGTLGDLTSGELFAMTCLLEQDIRYAFSSFLKETKEIMEREEASET